MARGGTRAFAPVDIVGGINSLERLSRSWAQRALLSMGLMRVLVACTLCLVGCARSFEVLSHSDAGASLDAPADDGTVAISDASADAGPDGGAELPNHCRRQVAEYVSCVTDPCVEVHYRWNGIECEQITGCNCTGPDCDAIFDNPSDCANAYASCPAELCRVTGGAFYPRGGCGDKCGHFSESICFTPIDTCICAPGKTFDPERGCAVDASCDASALCLATGGAIVDSCNSVCGTPGGGDSPAGCNPGCHCGAYMTWDSAVGCAPTCGASVESQCLATGGTVTTGCSYYHCGVLGVPREPCDETGPMCDCGATKNFVDGRGCVDDVTCGLGLGVTCDPEIAPPCADGLRCCYDFVGPGVHVCMAPQCDEFHDDVGCPKPND